MQNKLIIILFITILLITTTVSVNAELRSGISFESERIGIKLIELLREDDSFYIDIKTESETEAMSRLGYRRYLDKNNGLFADISVAIRENQDTSQEEIGFTIGGGYIYQLSELYFLNLEAGYNSVDTDSYFGGSIDISWSNLGSRILSFDSVDRSSINRVDRFPTVIERDYNTDYSYDREEELEQEDEEEDIEDDPEEELEQEDEVEDIDEDAEQELEEFELGVDYFLYEGRGNESIELNEDYKSGILAVHGNIGTRNSSLIGYDDNGEQTEDFLTDNGSYRGRDLIYFQPKEGTSSLEVRIPGNWQLLSLPMINEISDIISLPAEVSAKGSKLIAVGENPAKIKVESNQAGEEFKVIVWHSNLNKQTIVETTEPYSESINLPQSGVYIIEVITSGNWQISLE